MLSSADFTYNMLVVVALLQQFEHKIKQVSEIVLTSY